MKSVLKQIIERDTLRLQTLVNIYKSDSPIMITGFKEEVWAKIEEVTGKIIMNEMLLGAERQQIQSSFKRGVSFKKKSSFRYRKFF